MGSHFDELAKAVARGASRRRVLQGMLGGFAAALGAALLPSGRTESAEASESTGPDRADRQAPRFNQRPPDRLTGGPPVSAGVTTNQAPVRLNQRQPALNQAPVKLNQAPTPASQGSVRFNHAASNGSTNLQSVDQWQTAFNQNRRRLNQSGTLTNQRQAWLNQQRGQFNQRTGGAFNQSGRRFNQGAPTWNQQRRPGWNQR